MANRKLSYDYVRGLIDGEGTFTFTTSTGRGRRIKVPAFQLRMNIRDRALIESVRDLLKLKNKVYIYHYPHSGGISRGPQAMLIVREYGAMKNVVIPMFYDKLIGHKAIQFNEWLEKIGRDPLVPESYRLFYRLHKAGFFKKNHKFD